MSDVVQLLSDLISRPSPNPPGDTRGVAQYVHSFLSGLGFSSRLISPDEQAVSVLAEIGNPSGPTIMYHAHLDTVPAGQKESWKMEPFAATIAEDRVYGRGACDDKGVLAAMLAAASALAGRAGKMKGRLVVVGAADEEVGGARGTRMMVEKSLLGRPDFVVIGEQTGNRVALAHKGIFRTRITVLGRAAHATNPRRGVNAIHKMARVLSALERYDAGLQRKPHPLLGSPSATVGTISGGTAPNVVPDWCSIEIDRRFVPGENPTAIVAELEAVLRELSTLDPELQLSMSDSRVGDSFETEGKDRFTAGFMEVVRLVTGGNPGPVGYLPGADAKHFKLIPEANVVIFGPGSYEVAHSADEYVPIGELRQAEEILTRFAEGVLLA